MIIELNCITFLISVSVIWGLPQGYTNAVYATVRDVCAELDKDNKPGVAIKKGLSALFPLEIIILDACHVLFDSHDSLDAILLAKEPG